MSIWSRIEDRLSGIVEDIGSNDLTSALLEVEELLQKGKVSQAIQGCEDLRDSYPKRTEPLLTLADIYNKEENFSAAQKAYEGALRIDPNSDQALVGRGTILLQKQLFDPATADFQRILRSARGDRNTTAQAYYQLAIVELLRNIADQKTRITNSYHARALRHLQNAVEEKPDFPMAQVLLADVLLARYGDSFAVALAHIESAKNYGQLPGFIARLLVAERALRGKQWTVAKDFLSQVLSNVQSLTDSTDPVTKYYLHRLYYAQGEVSLACDTPIAAREHFWQALQYNDTALARVKLAYCNLTDNPKLALSQLVSLSFATTNIPIPLLEKFLHAILSYSKNKPTTSPIFLSKDTSFESLGLSLAEEILKQQPEHSLPHLVRATFFYRNKKFIEAKNSVSVSLAIEPQIEAILLLSHIQKSLKETSLEETSLEETSLDKSQRELARWALDIAPDLPVAQEFFCSEYSVPSLPSSSSSQGALLELVTHWSALTEVNPSFTEGMRPVTQAVHRYSQPLCLTIVGEFSSGKSSLINALIGSPIVPVGVTPTTAVVHKLIFGNGPKGTIVKSSGDRIEIPWDNLAVTLSNIVEDPNLWPVIQYVEIAYPDDTLRQVTVVDTPGLNSVVAKHEEVTQDFIRSADAVLWVFSATQAAKVTEHSAIQQIHQLDIPLFAVINKSDLLSDQEQTDLLSHLRTAIGKYFVDMKFVSAKNSQSDNTSQWSSFTASISSHFFEKASSIKKTHLIRQMSDITSTAEQTIHAELSNIKLGLSIVREQKETLEEGLRKFGSIFLPSLRENLYEQLKVVCSNIATEISPYFDHNFSSRTLRHADTEHCYRALTVEVHKVIHTLQESTISYLMNLFGPLNISLQSLPQEIGHNLLQTSLYVPSVVTQLFAPCYAFVRGTFSTSHHSAHSSTISIAKTGSAEEELAALLVRDLPDIDKEVTGQLHKMEDLLFNKYSRQLEAVANKLKAQQFALHHIGTEPISELQAYLLEYTKTQPHRGQVV